MTLPTDLWSDNVLNGLAKKIRSAPRTFAVLIGAGMSKAAGIPLAGEITESLTEAKIHSLCQQSPGLSRDDAMRLLQTQGYFRDPASAYGDSIRLMYPTRQDRQQYFESILAGKTPTPAHKYLAALVKNGLIDTIITTNFDKLMEAALLAANVPFRTITHDELTHYADIRGECANVIKLHGDYLYSNIKNLSAETAALSSTMEQLFTTLLSQYGLIVVGFGGADASVMHPLRKIETPSFLKRGLYWIHRAVDRQRVESTSLLQSVLNRGTGNVVLLEIESADMLFKKLCEAIFDSTVERREIAVDHIEVHVCGICFMPGPTELEVLLGKRSNRKELYPGLWHCGGGAVRAGENFAEATIRECQNEFGVEVSVVAPIRTYEIATPQLPQKKIPGIVFLCEFANYTNGQTPVVDGSDVVEYRWQPLSRLHELEMIPSIISDIRLAVKLHDSLHARRADEGDGLPMAQVAAVCLRRVDGRTEVLLGKRSSGRKVYPQLWDSGGGGVLSGEESFEEAVIRELSEEMGAIVKPVAPIQTYSVNISGRRIPGVVFLCEVIGYRAGANPEPDMTETVECRWMPVSEADTLELVPGLRSDIDIAVRFFDENLPYLGTPPGLANSP